MPVLGALVRVQTDPVLWRLTVDGKPIEVTTEILMSSARFRQQAMEQLSMLLPMVKQGTWDKRIKELHKEHTIEEAPEAAGVIGTFIMFVADFMLLRLSSNSDEDLLRGRPYTFNKRVYFRPQDLLSFLERRRFSSYDVSKIYSILTARGVQTHRLRIKGARLSAWSLPEPEDEQSEEFTSLSGEVTF